MLGRGGGELGGGGDGRLGGGEQFQSRNNKVVLQLWLSSQFIGYLLVSPHFSVKMTSGISRGYFLVTVHRSVFNVGLLFLFSNHA